VTDQPCPGACNATWRVRGSPETESYRLGEPVWCHPCAARTRRQFAELDYLAALRDFQTNGYREQGRDPAAGNGHPPSPSPAADDLTELRSLLYESEDQYRALKGWEGPAIRHGHLATATTEIIVWLWAHFDGVMASALAEPFGLEVQRLHRQLAAKTRAGTGRRRGAIPCPWCDWMTLTLDDGADYWACGNPGPPPCRCRLDKREYDELAARHLERAG
jgi:hypothetical protein